MGLIHFQKIQSLDFFHHLSLENSEKYWPFDTDLVKFWQRHILLFCVLHFNVFWNCPLSDFNFCLQASYACSELFFYQISWNSNERFRRNQCIFPKPCSHNFLVNCACVAFDRLLDLSQFIQTIPERQGFFFNSYL